MKGVNLLIVIVISLLALSCRNLNLFRTDNLDDVSLLIDETRDYEPRVQVDDKISVSVWGHSDLSIGSVYGVYNSNEVFGKWLLVEPDSTIILPRIGKIKVAGITVSSLNDTLVNYYKGFIKSPVVDVKIHSHEVSVIGQVIKPGNYSIYRANNSISYMIAAAGGTDFYAQLDQVKLVRGEKSYVLDLTKISPLDMSRINLIAGDILYFPTKKGKVLEKKSTVLVAFSSLATIALLILSSTK